MLQRNATTQNNNFHHSHFIYHQNHEEQHYEDSEEQDEQEDVKDMEKQMADDDNLPQPVETNEVKKYFDEGSQVMIAPSRSSVTLASNDDQAFIKMGIQFVKAVRTSDWKLADEYGLKLDNYFHQNVFSRSKKAALWSLLTSKL